MQYTLQSSQLSPTPLSEIIEKKNNNKQFHGLQQYETPQIKQKLIDQQNNSIHNQYNTIQYIPPYDSPTIYKKGSFLTYSG